MVTKDVVVGAVLVVVEDVMEVEVEDMELMAEIITVEVEVMVKEGKEEMVVLLVGHKAAEVDLTDEVVLLMGIAHYLVVAELEDMALQILVLAVSVLSNIIQSECFSMNIKDAYILRDSFAHNSLSLSLSLSKSNFRGGCNSTLPEKESAI